MESAASESVRQQFDQWFAVADKLPHPLWDRIGPWIDQLAAQDARDVAWEAVVHEWIRRLNDGLRGRYRLVESPNFLVFTREDDAFAKKLSDLAEDAVEGICNLLKEVVAEEFPWKMPILVLPVETYYTYLAHYDPPEGHFGASGGCFVPCAYPHLAFYGRDLNYAWHVLVHELTHASLYHLPLPGWLNEGLAVLMEEELSPRYAGRLDPWGQKEFWTGDKFQAFWTGDSFHAPDDGQGLSYKLALILVSQLGGRKNFRQFVAAADRKDAGQAAAKQILGIDLGDLVAAVLGPGPWEPRPQQWEQEDQKEKKGSDQQG